jgi:hypothetical protein
MDSEEKDIFDYLKSWGRQFVSAREICRRAGGRKKWDKSPHWAMPLLNAMVDKNILETDSMAHYRIRPDEKTEKRERWLSPEVAKILKERGLDAEKPHDITAESDGQDGPKSPQ